MSVLSLSRLKRGLESPNLFLREANRLYHRRFYTRPYNTSGVDIFEEDWDNLVILDACRYDMFVEEADLPGQLETRRSRGSNTVEFLRGNFHDRTLHDTVYVTGNPQLYRNRDWIQSDLHATVEVWHDDGWDDHHRTVLPETMVDRTLEAAEQYPDKRLVSHFVQPHYPFLVEESVFDDDQAFLRPDEPGCWHQVMTGQLSVSKSAVWDAYRETLRTALPHVRELIESLDGTTVVTADHGNMVGERGRPVPVVEWGHPRSVYTEQLVKIPWLVIDGDRRNIRREEPESQTEVADEVVTERLEDLGYA